MSQRTFLNHLALILRRWESDDTYTDDDAIRDIDALMVTEIRRAREEP